MKWKDGLSLALICAVVLGGVHLLQSHASGAQGEALRAVVRPGDIRMLSSETCIYCTRARAWLAEQQVPFTECTIETDRACLAEFQARGGLGTPTLVVRGRTQQGFDPQRVAEALSR
ncbi:glutaredoxin family protein [Pelomonas sp. KK5]|uniref:glutaredoxin family protein n=1 Tax=Pelomonas sp. KK5 TaxID=1855730 RepID=UPI001301B8FF|nr:glutaredoxin family protein [Pelomonas sp. KK5]